MSRGLVSGASGASQNLSVDRVPSFVLLGLRFLPSEAAIVTKPQRVIVSPMVLCLRACCRLCAVIMDTWEAAEPCGKLAGLGTYLRFPFCKFRANDIHLKWWF